MKAITKFSIERFMTKELGLSGNQLVLFAAMWSDSNGGKDAVNDDYIRYSAAINTSIPTYYGCLKKLEERGVLKMEAKGIYTIVKSL